MAPYHTVQSKTPFVFSSSSCNKHFFELKFEGLVGGIGIATLNDPKKGNIYKHDSYLLSGYGQVYTGGSGNQYSFDISGDR